MQSEIILEQDPRERPKSSDERYLALVWRRFKRNKLALVSMWLILAMLILAIFASFFAPQDPAQRSNEDVYLPPQGIHFFSEEGFSLRPFVYTYETTFDPETFEAKYALNTDKKVYLQFFSEGWEYNFLGMTLNTHLFSAQDNQRVYLLGTDGMGRDELSRIFHGMGVT